MQKYLPTHAAAAASPLAPDQLSDRDGEPRIRDLALAARLGFTDPHSLRRIVQRNEAELKSYGELSDAASETSTAGGRPGREYWLNEGQALVICALSRTPQAAAVRKQVIEVFLAWRRGKLTSATGSEERETIRQTVAKLRGEVAQLRQRVALIAAAPIRENSDGVDALYGVTAIARFLGVPKRAAQHQVTMGRLPIFRMGRAIGARKSTLSAWLADCERDGADGGPIGEPETVARNLAALREALQ